MPSPPLPLAAVLPRLLVVQSSWVLRLRWWMRARALLQHLHLCPQVHFGADKVARHERKGLPWVGGTCKWQVKCLG